MPDVVLASLISFAGGALIGAAGEWWRGRRSAVDRLASEKYAAYSNVIAAARLVPHELYRAMEVAYGEGKDNIDPARRQPMRSSQESLGDFHIAYQTAMGLGTKPLKAALEDLRLSLEAAFGRYQQTYGVDPSVKFWSRAAEPVLASALRFQGAMRVELQLPN